MELDSQLKLFKKSLPQRVDLQEIARMVGPTTGKVCLDIGLDNAVMSRILRKQGGEWHTLTSTEESQSLGLKVLGDNVDVLDGVSTPFEDKMFDTIVISNCLEKIPDDKSLVTECHRIIKPGGALVLSVPHAKQWSLLAPLRNMLGMSSRKAGFVRNGYTELELFDLLKSGFDVHAVHSHSRTLLELVNTFVRFTVKRKYNEKPSDDELAGIYKRAYPFFWLAFQLDVLLFFTKGYRLVARGVRHAWRPREAPVLTDGRSLTDAVLSRVGE